MAGDTRQHGKTSGDSTHGMVELSGIYSSFCLLLDFLLTEDMSNNRAFFFFFYNRAFILFLQAFYFVLRHS